MDGAQVVGSRSIICGNSKDLSLQCPLFLALYCLEHDFGCTLLSSVLQTRNRTEGMRLADILTCASAFMITER